jgi:hypothetical protein
MGFFFNFKKNQVPDISLFFFFLTVATRDNVFCTQLEPCKKKSYESGTSSGQHTIAIQGGVHTHPCTYACTQAPPATHTHARCVSPQAAQSRADHAAAQAAYYAGAGIRGSGHRRGYGGGDRELCDGAVVVLAVLQEA